MNCPSSHRRGPDLHFKWLLALKFRNPTSLHCPNQGLICYIGSFHRFSSPCHIPWFHRHFLPSPRTSSYHIFSLPNLTHLRRGGTSLPQTPSSNTTNLLCQPLASPLSQSMNHLHSSSMQMDHVRTNSIFHLKTPPAGVFTSKVSFWISMVRLAPFRFKSMAPTTLQSYRHIWKPLHLCSNILLFLSYHLSSRFTICPWWFPPLIKPWICNSSIGLLSLSVLADLCRTPKSQISYRHTR